MAARHSTHTMDRRLLKAVTTGNAGLLAEVLAEQGDPNFLNGVTAEGSSALHIAASRGYLELAEMLCAQDISLVNARNNLLDTPLICAARAGHVGVVNFLIDRAPAVQHPVLRVWNLHGATAMHEAVRNGHASVLQVLMHRDDSRLAAVVDEQGVSPLYLAVVSNRADMVRILIGESPHDSRASYTGPDGQTALHAAVYANNAQEISASLNNWDGSLTDMTDSSGRTALHYAASSPGRIGVVELLLRENSQCAYIPDNDGLFPVHIAAIAGNISAVHELTKICLNYDELLDNKRRNILHCAVEHGRVKVVWHICRNTECYRMMNAGDNEGNTPLHLAVKYGRARIFSFLMMDHRVNLDITNNEGLTPLDVAFSQIHSSDYTFSSFINTSMITCLTLCEASGSPCHHARNPADSWDEDKQSSSSTNVYGTIRSISAFVVISSLTAASTPPGGCSAEGKDAGNKLAFGGRTGCLVFMIANTISFFLPTVTITLSMFARLTMHRRFYLILSAALVFGAVLFMLITFAMAVGLILYPGSNWDEEILSWLVSNLSFPICLWIAMQLWTSKHRWQDISKVVALFIFLIYVVRASIITVESIVKAVLPGREEPCSWPECVIQDNAVFLHPT